ncbi:MAG: hypothetical protein H7252_02745 [Cytophaga sp.]|nr:hypothetical protein [Undibacterium sp.]
MQFEIKKKLMLPFGLGNEMKSEQTNDVEPPVFSNNKGYLDKTVTLKQILIFTFFCLGSGISIYCYWAWNYWQGVSHGGVSIVNSEYRAQIPARCLDNIDVHRGPPTALNSKIVPAPRTFAVPLEKLIAAPECSAYQLLSGLHGDQWASFRVIYINAKGEKLVTRTVEYLKK